MVPQDFAMAFGGAGRGQGKDAGVGPQEQVYPVVYNQSSGALFGLLGPALVVVVDELQWYPSSQLSDKDAAPLVGVFHPLGGPCQGLGPLKTKAPC